MKRTTARIPPLAFEDGGHATPSESSRLRAGRLECFAALAGGAAHEMSNLMATVLMSVDVLRDDRSSPAAREVLAALELTTRRGLGVIRQLHQLASGMNGFSTLFQPRFLLSDLQALASSTFSPSIVVIVGYPPDLWVLDGDPLLLYQALLDRLLVARDALGGSGTVELAVRNAWFTPESGEAGEAVGGEAGGELGEEARGAIRHVVFEVTARQPASSGPPSAPSRTRGGARCVGWRELRARSGPRQPGRAAFGRDSQLWLPAAAVTSEEAPEVRAGS
jgi:signal transduction histidine kinase